MIRTFRDKDLEIFFYSKGKIHVKSVPSELRKATYHKLLMINRAETLQDLRVFPSNHLEKLLGKSLKRHSIRINIRYRLIFT